MTYRPLSRCWATAAFGLHRDALRVYAAEMRDNV